MSRSRAQIRVLLSDLQSFRGAAPQLHAILAQPVCHGTEHAMNALRVGMAVTCDLYVTPAAPAPARVPRTFASGCVLCSVMVQFRTSCRVLFKYRVSGPHILTTHVMAQVTSSISTAHRALSSHFHRLLRLPGKTTSAAQQRHPPPPCCFFCDNKTGTATAGCCNRALPRSAAARPAPT